MGCDGDGRVRSVLEVPCDEIFLAVGVHGLCVRLLVHVSKLFHLALLLGGIGRDDEAHGVLPIFFEVVLRNLGHHASFPKPNGCLKEVCAPRLWKCFNCLLLVIPEVVSVEPAAYYLSVALLHLLVIEALVLEVGQLFRAHLLRVLLPSLEAMCECSGVRQVTR